DLTRGSGGAHPAPPEPDNATEIPMPLDVTGGEGPHAGRPIRRAGAPLERARGALVLVHGRGGDAADILGLAGHLGAEDLAAWLDLSAETARAVTEPKPEVMAAEAVPEASPDLESLRKEVQKLVEAQNRMRAQLDRLLELARNDRRKD
nr:hypothetical protein [Planctomycetota bacterium]